MSVYALECAFCKKVFKTLYSLRKHSRERHDTDESIQAVWKDQEGKMLSLPKPRNRLPQEMLRGYKIWVAGLVERINSTFHPRLPGRWIKIDSHQVPKAYFEHLIQRIDVQLNSVREVCHKAQPSYKSKSMKLSYKIWDVEKLLHALEDQDIVPINTDVLYAGNEQSEEQGQELLTAEEEIERVKKRIHAAGHKRKRPSSSLH